MVGKNGTATTTPMEVEGKVDPAVFQDFADLEKEFAKAELDALRRKEFALRPLYAQRTELSDKIPNFWPSVIFNGPEEFQSILGGVFAEAVACIKTFSVERYQLVSETEGEPRSLRFTFEFNENDLFEDKKIVKEFEFVVDQPESQSKSGNSAGASSDNGESGDGLLEGVLISKPVTFKWKKKGQKYNGGLLDAAVDLFKAEESTRLKLNGKAGADLPITDRENLWVYEKLRAKLEKAEEEADPMEPCWLDWFGYRGPVARKDKTLSIKHLDDDEDSQDEDDEDDGILDVEIFPGGEEIAIALAEDLWPNALDYFLESQRESMSDAHSCDTCSVPDHQGDDGSDGEEAPELVETEEKRPLKRQRRS